MQPVAGLVVELQHGANGTCIAHEHAAHAELCLQLAAFGAVLVRGEGLVVAHHHGLDVLEVRRCESLRAIETVEMLGQSGRTEPHPEVAEIARSVHLTEGTVRNHLSAAIGKTGARNRADATRIAEEHGWL